MTPYAKSPCCQAPVVGMIDITVHPRMRADGTYGPLTDTMADVRRAAAMTPADDPYCVECGGPVEERREET